MAAAMTINTHVQAAQVCDVQQARVRPGCPHRGRRPRALPEIRHGLQLRSPGQRGPLARLRCHSRGRRGSRAGVQRGAPAGYAGAGALGQAARPDVDLPA